MTITGCGGGLVHLLQPAFALRIPQAALITEPFLTRVRYSGPLLACMLGALLSALWAVIAAKGRAHKP
ncbi:MULTISPECIES: hypothetical protein [Serratia]|uniref:hypothetical protein n=1 Tax=Serratia TaxID=613 RepID=UPI000760AD5C|nr:MULTISPECIES: hypothetical protein [Serratia]MBI6177901.1 hypothetical protein [Serratia marcescens]MDY0768126.1 hypothetical protein [Serratia nevei]MED6026191.1 hypothetical protein [Serratia marcescens]NDY36053.1 MHS family MFS transporter [Serratia marcescens]NDY40704.1 MHS family MFS transporter [Serratia marcescens]